MTAATLPRAAAFLPSEGVVVAVALFYVVVVAAIAVWSARRTRTAGDFFLAGRRIGPWTLSIAAMSATLSGFAFVGGPGLVHTVGLGAVFIVLSASITGTMGAWVVGKRLRLLGEARALLTIPDAIGARYGSRAAQGLAGVAILVAVIGYMATNLLALGLVVDATFGIGLGASVWLGMAVVLAYSASGGILAGVYTDVFQGAIMAIASVLVFVFALDAGGGMGAISRTLLERDPALVGPWGRLTPVAALSLFFVFAIGSLGQPHVVHKFYMLRDPRLLKWYPLLMTGSLVVTLLLFFAVGLSTKALVVTGRMAPLATPDAATPRFLLEFTPVLLAAVVFAGVVAAIMSTVNSFLSIGAAAITHDLPAAFGRRVTRSLRWGRISTILISIVAALLALLPGTLVAFLGIFGFGLFASTLVPALAIGLNWHGATRTGAIASIATGLAGTLIFETLAWFRVYSFPEGVTVSGMSLALSMLVFFVASWLTRRSAAAAIAPDVRLVMDL